MPPENSSRIHCGFSISALQFRWHLVRARAAIACRSLDFLWTHAYGHPIAFQFSGKIGPIQLEFADLHAAGSSGPDRAHEFRPASKLNAPSKRATSRFAG